MGGDFTQSLEDIANMDEDDSTLEIEIGGDAPPPTAGPHLTIYSEDVNDS